MDPGLDGGVHGIDGEGRRHGEDETEEEAETGVSDLSTDGLDTRLAIVAGSSNVVILQYLLFPQTLFHREGGGRKSSESE